MKWQPNDKINSKDQLSGYIYDFYEGDQANECFKDLNDFLTSIKEKRAVLRRIEGMSEKTLDCTPGRRKNASLASS
ncbi:hypothetical protein JG688_00001487 [Phytophthora aleatoria]|uniref:Uncharacterized protein n=1 Tax=Phytophthora aleatoria TaxID=2496075 RepID=A0A8J5JGQ6_9STRA|nr:hypothetical protein JG688_00001487 [Phytophthora aleatoria]